MLTNAELRRLLEAIPRLPYIRQPTPLQSSPNLTKQLNGLQAWIKRDDQIGPGLGGNKGRPLAYIMADVLDSGKKKVVTYGGLQSNHARMTAACCAQLGLDAHLFYFERRPPELSGNLLLCELFGGRMHFIPLGAGGNGGMRLETAIFLVKSLSLFWPGPGAYFIPGGGHNVKGCLGYVEAAVEIDDQIKEVGLAPEKVTIVVPCGTGGTLAGLMAGFRLLASPVRLIGIDIGRLWKGFDSSIANLSAKVCQHLGHPVTFPAEDVPLVKINYAGPGYAVFTEAVGEGIRSLAHNEGILLDPVYTGKAFAGMLDLSAKGYFPAGSHVVFLHTGGLPGLWAYSGQLTGA